MPLNRSRSCVLGALWALSALGATACQQDLVGTPPPDEVFYFPIGLTLNDAGDLAYVVNSNFDLQFNSGWLSTVDLSRVVGSGEALIDPVPKDPSENLPGAFVDVVASQLRIPSLGGVIATGDQLLYVAHRSDRLVSIIEVDDERAPSCGDADAEARLSLAERRTDCDRAHLFEITGDAAEDVSSAVDLTDFDVGDPFSIAVVDYDEGDGPERYLFAGQLAIARLNAIAAIPEEQFLCLGTYDDRLRNSAGEPNDARRSDEERRDNPNACYVEDQVVDYGRSELLLSQGRFNRVLQVPVAAGASEPYNFLAAVGIIAGGNTQRAGIVHINLDQFFAGESDFSTDYVVGSGVGGREFADLVFSPDGAFAYGATRVTARTAGDSARGSVIRMDASIVPVERRNDVGELEIVRRPSYEVDAVTALRGQPSGIVYLERASGPDIVVVADLDQDALFVLDAESAEMPVLGRIDVSGGPFSMASTVLEGREYVVVTLFYEHGLALVDVSSPNPAQFRLAHVVRNSRLDAAERAR